MKDKRFGSLSPHELRHGERVETSADVSAAKVLRSIVGPDDKDEVTTEGGFCLTYDKTPLMPKRKKVKIPKGQIPHDGGKA